MGYFGVFMFYALCSLSGALFTWLFLPETKNKSLAEIQAKLNTRTARRPRPVKLRKRRRHRKRKAKDDGFSASEN